MKLSPATPTAQSSSIASSRLRRRAGAFATALTVTALWSGAALADQLVVVDSSWEHTPDLADSHYRVVPLAGTPANWQSPVDYASGTAHVHLEVKTKPTETPTRFQVCFEATPTYACTDQSPTYTTVGVLDWETPFANFWSPPGTSVDWTQGTKKIAIILKDTKNGKPSADNVGKETAALYTPTEVHMVVTLVAKGSTYEPPPPPVVDAGAGDSGALVDGGAGGSGGAGGATGTGDPVTAGDTVSSSGSSSAGTSTGAGESGSGCGVAPASRSARSAGWLLFGLAAMGALRLRRRG